MLSAYNHSTIRGLETEYRFLSTHPSNSLRFVASTSHYTSGERQLKVPVRETAAKVAIIAKGEAAWNIYDVLNINRFRNDSSMIAIPSCMPSSFALRLDSENLI